MQRLVNRQGLDQEILAVRLRLPRQLLRQRRPDLPRRRASRVHREVRQRRLPGPDRLPQARRHPRRRRGLRLLHDSRQPLRRGNFHSPHQADHDFPRPVLDRRGAVPLDKNRSRRPDLGEILIAPTCRWIFHPGGIFRARRIHNAENPPLHRKINRTALGKSTTRKIHRISRKYLSAAQTAKQSRDIHPGAAFIFGLRQKETYGDKTVI